MSTLNPLIDFIPTKYYFDTFVIGAHYSAPHLIYDLQHRKELVSLALQEVQTEHKTVELNKLSQMIDNALDKLNLHELDNLEDSEQEYWINRLGRQSALEISTSGRIRPETLDKLMCMEEDDFEQVMAIAGKLSRRIKNLGDYSIQHEVPIPQQMPVIS